MIIYNNIPPLGTRPIKALEPIEVTVYSKRRFVQNAMDFGKKEEKGLSSVELRDCMYHTLPRKGKEE